jgi:drug/metabolite transporter (DMT)-like permease
MAGLRALCVIATAWVAATCIASQAGSSYVRATADCLTPVLLCQAATLAGLHAARRWQQQQQQHRGPAAAAAPADAQQPHAGWHLALAALNVLGGALTLASFALSSVSFTYIVRTLEPLCSCVLLAAVQLRQPCSPTEFVLLLLVATSTCCVVSRDAAHAAQDMSSLAGMVAGGSAGACVRARARVFVACCALACVLVCVCVCVCVCVPLALPSAFGADSS